MSDSVNICLLKCKPRPEEWNLVALLDRVSWDGRTPRRAHGSPRRCSPDDYLALLNPLWTTRELRGVVEQVVPETDDAATVVIRPGWGWSYDHHPGQYVGIGIQIKGQVPLALPTR
jgi:hypothetical protein